jgi:hypothetical protein
MIVDVPTPWFSRKMARYLELFKTHGLPPMGATGWSRWATT